MIKGWPWPAEKGWLRDARVANSYNCFKTLYTPLNQLILSFALFFFCYKLLNAGGITVILTLGLIFVGHPVLVYQNSNHIQLL